MHGVELRIDYGGKIGIVLYLGETKYHTGHTFKNIGFDNQNISLAGMNE